jgi:hypothetical protein
MSSLKAKKRQQQPIGKKGAQKVLLQLSFFYSATGGGVIGLTGKGGPALFRSRRRRRRSSLEMSRGIGATHNIQSGWPWDFFFPFPN